jgi:hypothetical protein
MTRNALFHTVAFIGEEAVRMIILASTGQTRNQHACQPADHGRRLCAFITAAVAAAAAAMVAAVGVWVRLPPRHACAQRRCTGGREQGDNARY